MARKILNSLLFIIGFLIVFVLWRPRGVPMPHPVLFFVFGAAYFIGEALVWKLPTIRGEKAKKKKLDFIQNLKETGEQIIVDFDKCVVKYNNYSEERLKEIDDPFFTSQAKKEMMQGSIALFDPEGGVENVEINQAVLIYEHNHYGTIERYTSPILKHDKATFLLKLDIKKTTTLYVDAEERSRYYFDMEFLKYPS